MTWGEASTHKFTGYEEESGIGLYYARARFYHPGIGRFISPDPAGQFWSPYAYVGNRPLDLVDPDGRFSFKNFLKKIFTPIGKGINAAFGGSVHSNVPTFFGGSNLRLTDMGAPFGGSSNFDGLGGLFGTQAGN